MWLGTSGELEVGKRIVQRIISRMLLLTFYNMTVRFMFIMLLSVRQALGEQRISMSAVCVH